MNISGIIKALVLCGISTAVGLVLLAAVCNAADIPSSGISIITFAISVICVFLWSLMSARGTDRGGLIHGGTIGLLYGIIFVCLSVLCSGSIVFSAHIATMLCTVILSGMLGGVVGINTGR